MTTIKVSNMNCEHCVKNITKALQQLELVHEINLEQKILKVEANNLELFDLFESLEEIGYEWEKIE